MKIRYFNNFIDKICENINIYNIIKGYTIIFVLILKTVYFYKSRVRLIRLLIII